MHKRPLEHKVKVVRLDSKEWDGDADKIAKLADEMQDEGFTLANILAPNDKIALVVFTRPRR